MATSILNRKFRFDLMYRYSLQPYKGMKTRYTCPGCNRRQTFVRYADNTTGSHLADNVGRCSREVKCGYHYTPRQFFKDAGSPLANTYTYTPPPHREPSFIAPRIFEQSFAGYNENNFVQFLLSRFGREVTNGLVNRYHIGTSRHWHGATVFWQMDKDGKIRTGKIMLYDATTGKRVKTPYNHINWVHAVLQLPDYELRQCLFGAHLLPQSGRDKPLTVSRAELRPIAIVESEKTAIIASVYLPQFTWLACGSLASLTADRCSVLRGHHVTLFPDLNCYEKWKAKAKELSHIATVNVSHLLELKATEQERACGLDLADYLLRFDLETFTSALIV